MSNLDYSDFGETAEWSKTHFFQFGTKYKAQKTLFLISAKVPRVNFGNAVCFLGKYGLIELVSAFLCHCRTCYGNLFFFICTKTAWGNEKKSLVLDADESDATAELKKHLCNIRRDYGRNGA
ncbi:MAG: hypothetical protein II811_07095 [Spirochaetaceae bacterium]|nr:hypothetical protein [Spirochaetaceae bacterium]